MFSKLIDLIITKEWSTYLKDYGKAENKYNRVQASTAVNLLEKYLINFTYLVRGVFYSIEIKIKKGLKKAQKREREFYFVWISEAKRQKKTILN